MNYETMHWTQLKKLVEERGGEYTNKPDALIFLNQPAVGCNAPSVGSMNTATASDPVFDKSKPYGEICGSVDGAPCARYIQDGVFYNNNGVKVG